MTTTDVAQWFSDATKQSARPLPDQAALQRLADIVNTWGLRGIDTTAFMNTVAPHYDEVQQALACFEKAKPKLSAAKKLLAEFVASLERHGLDPTEVRPEAVAVLAAIDTLLAHYPARPRGRPDRHWDFWPVESWARTLREIALSAEWPASVHNDDGPLPYVLAQMIHAVSGQNVVRGTVARFFRSRAAADRI